MCLSAAIATLAAIAILQGFQASTAAWPPPVQQVPAESPALPVEKAMKTFFLPPGYRLELVAAEPLVRDPIVMDQDADGRLYVIEMPAFALDETMRDSHDPICQVVVLEDTDNDGRMDKRTVFLDKLILPRAVKVLAAGVLIGEPPNLWLAKDADGDLKADAKELVFDDYGRREGNVEHNANALYWGMDNTIYTSEHDWNLRWKDGKFIKEESLVRGQWNISQDDAGRIYRNWNEQPLFVDIIPVRYFVRNPNVVRTRGLYDILIERDETAIWPVRPTPGLQRAYRKGFLRPDGTATTYASSADPYIFRGDRLPQEMQGNAFVADSPTNLVHRLIVEDDGAGRLKARDGYEKGEIIASTDERFRPVNLFSAADGTLYIIDMYRGVVQDIAYQTEYLNTYIKQNGLALPVGLGRIYRLVHESIEPGPKPSLSDDTPEQLVKTLSHPNGWWRDMAQQLLVQRKATSAAPQLKRLAVSAPDWRTKLHAMWTLDGLDAIDAATIERALGDSRPEVRAAAVRISERWLRESNHPLHAAVLALASDRHWNVRYQLTASLGELPRDKRIAPIAAMLEKHGDDEIIVDAAISGLAGQEAAMLDRILESKAGEDQTADALTMLSAALAKARNAPAAQRIFEVSAGRNTPEWQRLALLRGMEMGLPGASGGGFLRRGQPAEKLTFPSEPRSLTQLADGSGEIAGLARAIAVRLDWPGKPAPAAAPPVLTAGQKALVATGRQVYGNYCAGCHMENGQGSGQGGKSLAGSEFVLGNPGAVMRVVLDGKDGAAGLMPPLRSSLNDDQIAAVVSYIRNAWGNAEFPVTPADAQETRGITSLRKTPWTDEEIEPFTRGRFRAAPPPRP